MSLEGKVNEVEIVGKRLRLLPEEMVGVRFKEIWKGQKGNCRRECLNCRGSGQELRFYPASFQERCVRCGDILTEPSIPL